MSDTAERQRAIDGIDAAFLTPLVRRALRDDDLEVADWISEPFGHSLDDVYGLARSIVRLRGTARQAGRQLPWTLVLKIVPPSRISDDPASPDNGERELLVYQSGLLAGRRGLEAAGFVGITQAAGGDRWLFLEEVVDDIGREWPADRYMLAARHVGQFNASYLAAATTVRDSWISRSPLRDAIGDVVHTLERLSGGLWHPLVAEAIPLESAAAILAALPKMAGWLDQLDRLPQALCHWDAHRANLFSRTAPDGGVRTVAIDWAGVGWGPLGADLSKMLSQTVHFFGLEASALPALEARLFEDYLQGLGDSGWCGDRRDVRFAYAVACSVRLMVRTAMALRLAGDDRARAAFERATGRSFAAMGRAFGTTLPYYLTLVAEAGDLA